VGEGGRGGGGDGGEGGGDQSSLDSMLEGGEGWPHALLAVVGMDGDDNRNGDCLSKKGVGQGKRRGGIER
jgi:hypothetical protein